MARPTTARAEPAPLETAPPVAGGVVVPEGLTGVLDPEGPELTAVPLLWGGGTPVPEAT
jgi:hypothetical protein